MKKYPIWLWILSLAATNAAAQMTEIHTFNSVNKPVADGNPAGVADTRLIPSAVSTITDVKVRLQISGEFNGDLYGYVTHSSGLTVLLNRPGRTAANASGYADSGIDLTFEESATNGDIHLYGSVTTPTAGLPLTGSWQPDGRKVTPSTVTDATARTATLSEFNGLDADGSWTLFLADMESGATNQLDSWELEITGKATPTITWPSPTAIVYGAALSGTQLNASASVPGAFVYSPPIDTVLNAGNGQTLSLTFTPTDTTSYAIVNRDVTIDVSPALLTIAGISDSKTYGDANPGLSASHTGFVNGDTVIDLDTQAVVTTTALIGSPVGPYSITASGAADANYNMAYVEGTLTVDAAALTITANNQSKTYGDANSPPTVAYSGFVNGDDALSLDTGVIVATTATALSPVGPYPIVVSDAADGNYNITFLDGTLTVNPAALLITADDQSRIFGESNPALTVTYSGFVNGDDAADLDTGVTVSTTAVAASPVGPYTITPSGAVDANYDITHANGTLTVSNAASSGVLVSSSNLIAPNQSLTLTATLSPVAPATGTPSGAVQFKVDGANLGTPVTMVGGVAQLVTTDLTYGEYEITADYPGDGNFGGTAMSFGADVVVNTPPESTDDTIDRYRSRSVKVLLTTLLNNDSDGDGESLTLSGIDSASSEGGTVAIAGSWVIYTAPEGFNDADSFTYTIEDLIGQQSTATVDVQVLADHSITGNISITDLGGGSFNVNLFGIPNTDYDLEYSDTIESQAWTYLIDLTTDALGQYNHIDTPPGGTSRFYRSVWTEPSP